MYEQRMEVRNMADNQQQDDQQQRLERINGQQPQRQENEDEDKKDAAHKVAGGVAYLLERVLDKGLAINGQIRIDRLILTSVDKGREIGLIPAPEEMERQQGVTPGEEVTSLKQEGGHEKISSGSSQQSTSANSGQESQQSQGRQQPQQSRGQTDRGSTEANTDQQTRRQAEASGQQNKEPSS